MRRPSGRRRCLLANEEQANPYVGPRPFERVDRQLFFGRNREVRELLSIIVAHRAALVYAASGAGKTSLLNAGAMPLLEQEEGFEVLPVTRIRSPLAENDSLAAARNVYCFCVLSNLNNDLAESGDGVVSPDLTLTEFLGRRPHPLAEDELPAPRAVVFDQFEELFTVHPEYWRQRDDFMRQIAEALDNDSLLRVVIAIREDYLAQLDSLAPLLPGGLRARFRLGQLDGKAALQAVTGPVEHTSHSFAPGVAEKLISDLLTFRVDTESGEPLEVEGEYVEPVQLQVVCQNLWDDLPPEVTEISDEHLHASGDVDEVLGRFYDDAVTAAATRARVREAHLRRSIGRDFITSGGTRSTVYRASGDNTAAIPSEAMDELESRHVIRAEWRAGARWYELTHDRLIEPIQAANQSFFAARGRRRWRLARFVALAAVSVAAVAVGTAVLVIHNSGTPPRAPIVVAYTSTAVLTGHRGPVTSGVFTPDGMKIVTSGQDGTVRLWSKKKSASDLFVPTGVLHLGRGPIDTVDVSRNGKFIVTSNVLGTASVWSLRLRRPVVLLRAPRAGLVTAAFSPDPQGRFVVAAGYSGIAWIWDWRAREIVRRLAGHRDTVETATFSPNGRLVATASDDGTARIWNVSTGRPPRVLPGHSGIVYYVSFSPDGKVLATGGEDGRVRLWDVRSGRLLRTIPASNKTIYPIAFSPDGKLLASAGTDGLARVWSVRSGKLVGVLRGHGSYIQGIAFSPDDKATAAFDPGKLIVTASGDGTARVWTNFHNPCTTSACKKKKPSR